MELRLFQILVPLFTLFMCFGLIKKLIKTKISVFEGVIGMLFWLSIGVFALFPDYFSELIAKMFGIKSNINAIIFFCIGILFFVQYKLYFSMKQQEKSLTELTRVLALKDDKESS